MTDETTLPTVTDTGRRWRSTVAQPADILEEEIWLSRTCRRSPGIVTRAPPSYMIGVATTLRKRHASLQPTDEHELCGSTSSA